MIAAVWQAATSRPIPKQRAKRKVWRGRARSNKGRARTTSGSTRVVCSPSPAQVR
jgi:hypothetical protein